MTDEHTYAEPRTGDPLAAGLDRPLAELTVDELTALKDEFAKRGIQVYNSLTPEQIALIAAASVYSKAFLEALAKRHADAFAGQVRARFRKKGKDAQLEVGLDGDASAKIVITVGTPDEARLAVLDLDVTADEVCGKELCWDSGASAWRPTDDQ